MTISVVIATYNRAPLLADCLRSLQAQSYEPGDEVVIADNGSTDGTARLISETRPTFPVPLRYVHEPRAGKSHALAAALTGCNADVLALTDDDVRVAPDWLSRIRRVMTESGAKLVGGRVLPLFGSRVPDWLELADLHGFGRMASPLALLDYGPTRLPIGPRAILGANMAVERRVFHAAGGFAGSLGKLRGTLLSGEDDQLCQQVQAAGHLALYDPTIVVHHVVPAERLRVGYFLRWFFWSGVTHARLDAARANALPRVLGLPRYPLRLAGSSGAVALGAALTAGWARAVAEATRTAFALGYIWASQRDPGARAQNAVAGPRTEAA